jgi:thiol-disulfide isomerase/thioredoxin
MNAVVVSVLLLGLVISATAIGLLWRKTSGRIRTDLGDTVIDLAGLSAGAVAGRQATLLQFSTEVCAACATTSATLRSVASELAGFAQAGVVHLEVDVTRRADIASRFNLLQSPTTLILDDRGVIRARIGGAPRAAEVRAELDRIIAEEIR